MNKYDILLKSNQIQNWLERERDGEREWVRLVGYDRQLQRGRPNEVER